MEKIAIRDAVNNIIQFTNDFTKYKNEGVNKETFETCREKLTLLLHPVIPHMTEEIWELIYKEGYASLASWPAYDNKLLTEESDYKWKLMNNIIEDIINIKLAMKKDTLRNILIIIADRWKLKFYKSFMSLVKETKSQGEIMKKLMQEVNFKKYSKYISQTVAKMLKNIGKYPSYTLASEDEFQFFKEITPIIEKRFNSKVNVINEKDSIEQKASQALPGKPAIVIS